MILDMAIPCSKPPRSIAPLGPQHTLEGGALQKQHLDGVLLGHSEVIESCKNISYSGWLRMVHDGQGWLMMVNQYMNIPQLIGG